MNRPAPCAVFLALVACAHSRSISAHDGPPFPILTDQRAGAYLISVWTDPDATDDGTPGGQFWITVERHDEEGKPPSDTRATVSARPLDRAGAARTANTEPVRGDITNQFAALIMDHEGPFAVRVTVEGSLGSVTLDTQVDATYDLRPPAYLVAVYVMPFVLAGLLWTRLLLRRRQRPGGSTPDTRHRTKRD